MALLSYPFVGQQRSTFGHGIEQSFGSLAVMDLTAAQAQRAGATVSIDKGMDLARKAA